MKKALALLFIMLGITSISYAQTPKNYTIKGVAIDSASREPVSYATVVLRQGVNNLKAVFTDDQGRFTITHNQEGTYSVHISFVGYNLLRKRIKLADEATVDIGTVEMRNTLELDEVVVIGQLITSDIDKTSYNTAVDPETPSLTALEMMRKVPMLSVDGDDNLQLKGQSNFKILINGKASTMMSRNYKDVLRSMPASSIKRIDVITNPPAKYDAEGVAGIINIITERKTNNSYYGQLFTMAETRGTLVGGGYLSASMGKFSLSANVFGAMLDMPSVESNYTREDYVKDPLTGQIMETYRTKILSNSEFSVKMYNASIDASYEIDTFNLLSISFFGNSGRNTTNGLSTMEGGWIGNSTDRKYLNNNNNTSDNGSISGSIDYQRSFVKPDRLSTLFCQTRSTIHPLLPFGT